MQVVIYIATATKIWYASIYTITRETFPRKMKELGKIAIVCYVIFFQSFLLPADTYQ